MHTDLLLSGRVSQDVVLGLQQLLDLRCGRIEMNPSVVEGQMKTVASDAGFHQPLTNLIDSLGTRSECLHEVSRRPVTAIVGRVRVRDSHEHVS
jgi:hypothetical protein